MSDLSFLFSPRSGHPLGHPLRDFKIDDDDGDDDDDEEEEEDIKCDSDDDVCFLLGFSIMFKVGRETT